jgi:hypothetical protein
MTNKPWPHSCIGMASFIAAVVALSNDSPSPQHSPGARRRTRESDILLVFLVWPSAALVALLGIFWAIEQIPQDA